MICKDIGRVDYQNCVKVIELLINANARDEMRRESSFAKIRGDICLGAYFISLRHTALHGKSDREEVSRAKVVGKWNKRIIERQYFISHTQTGRQ